MVSPSKNFPKKENSPPKLNIASTPPRAGSNKADEGSWGCAAELLLSPTYY
jgi:hypothetical protein